LRAGVEREFTGAALAAGVRVAIAASRFHGPMVERLVDGATSELARLGARPVDLAWAPGAFELPQLAQTLARSGRYDAILALGVVIRGETPHFEYVAGAAAGGIARVAEQTAVPVLFGVLTVETREQAMDRSGGVHGNKGSEAAAGAVEMANLVRAIRPGIRS
jgi:6,7-dimethyl-8-ribityllumazine synthase